MTNRPHSVVSQFFLIVAVTLSFSQDLPAQAIPQVNRKFAKKVSVEIQDEPIGKFLNDLAQQHKVKIEIDKASLAEEGLSEKDQISLKLKDVSLFSVVDLASESSGLAVLPKGPGLVVTTQIAADEALYVKQYNLPWIRLMRIVPHDVVEAIEITTPGPWMTIDAEGGEFLAISFDALRVSQNWENHQIMENVFSQISDIVSGKGVTHESPSELAILKTLQKSVEPAESEPTINELLDQLLTQNGINYWIDHAELSNKGISLDSKVTLTGRKKMIIEHLRVALKPHDIVPFVENEVVKLTTTEAAAVETTTRVYDVRKQVRQTGSTSEVINVLQMMERTAPWVVIEQIGGEASSIGPLLLIEHHREAHQVIREALK